MIGDLEKLREAIADKCCEIGAKAWDRYKRGDHRANPYDEGRSDGADQCHEAVRNLDLIPFALPTDATPEALPVWLPVCAAVQGTPCYGYLALARQRNELQAKLAERDGEIERLRRENLALDEYRTSIDAKEEG